MALVGIYYYFNNRKKISVDSRFILNFNYLLVKKKSKGGVDMMTNQSSAEKYLFCQRIGTTYGISIIVSQTYTCYVMLC